MRYSQFHDLVTWLPMAIFNHNHPKIVEVTFSFRPQAFKCQRYRVDWQSNQVLPSLSVCKSQSICLFHQFILGIQEIIESWPNRSNPFFGHDHPKIIKVTWICLELIWINPKFVSTHQISVYLNNSFLRYSKFYLEFCDQSSHTHFRPR